MDFSLHGPLLSQHREDVEESRPEFVTGAGRQRDTGQEKSLMDGGRLAFPPGDLGLGDPRKQQLQGLQALPL